MQASDPTQPLPPYKESLERSPLRIFRERAGHSIESAAAFAKIHWQAWYMTECAVYAALPPAVLKAVDKMGGNTETLKRDYRQFQKEQRELFGIQYRDTFEYFNLPEFKFSQNPFRDWRTKLVDLSRQALAKRLCVQPAVLYKVEHGKSASLPEQVKEALEEAGCPVGVIEELDVRVAEHYYGKGA